MAKDEKRVEAERLYVKDGLSCSAIAEKIGVNEGTVYRWKADAAENGETADWDSQRRAYNLSPKALFVMYAEAIKASILLFQKKPELLLEGKSADTMAKHISVLQKLDVRSQYMGAILDLVEQANLWLAENQPEMKEKMEPYWDGIIQHLKKYTSDKGLF